MNRAYPNESVGSVMTAAVPTCKPSDKRQEVISKLVGNLWEDMHYIYVIDDELKLLGWVRIAELVQQPANSRIERIIRRATAKLSPYDDQELAVFQAVKNDLDAVPVVDENNKLLGAVVARSLIDIMHDEHVEDALLSVGIRRGKGMNILKLAQARIFPVIVTRAPWLVAGAIFGIALGFVASWFEEALHETIALAYFIPVVAFIADSVGAQSEAITVRALATLKISPGIYILREVAIGVLLGILLGLIGGVGAAVISQSGVVAVVVGISLAAATTVASALAASVPIFFKRLGKDPALAAGPLATAIQDLVSIIIYFLVAIWLI
jgi:magnesium transporter